MGLSDDQILAIERPDRNLLWLYLLRALATLILFPIFVWPFLAKYVTLRYSFDAEGVSARWGILFRREVYLTYRRIQDIHVKRNVFERWLGIGTVDLQTASGSSSAELALEGMRDYGAVRDFMYRRMRGHDLDDGADDSAGGERAGGEEQLVALLLEIRDDLEATRRALEAR